MRRGTLEIRLCCHYHDNIEIRETSNHLPSKAYSPEGTISPPVRKIPEVSVAFAVRRVIFRRYNVLTQRILYIRCWKDDLPIPPPLIQVEIAKFRHFARRQLQAKSTNMVALPINTPECIILLIPQTPGMGTIRKSNPMFPRVWPPLLIVPDAKWFKQICLSENSGRYASYPIEDQRDKMSIKVVIGKYLSWFVLYGS